MTFSSKSIFIPLSMIIFLSCLNYGMAEETYKWVDKNGRVHFSDRAPDDQNLKADIIGRDENIEVKEPLRNEEKINEVTTAVINPLVHTAESTFTIKGAKTIGTGFFISPNGYAITCRHVIEEGGSHTAVLHNQEEYPIGVISKSREHDLALVLVTTARRTPYLELRDPVSMKPGEKIYAVGSSVGLQSTITDGLFTGLRKQMPEEKRAVQFSAPVNPGNSGGPLIDMDGKVIGAVSWKLLSNNGIPVTGIGFAVPADYIINEYSGYMVKGK